MRRFDVAVVSILFVAAGHACSSDDAAPPAADPSEAGNGSGGAEQGQGGSDATEAGSAALPEAGSAQGGSESQGGAESVGGQALVGGAGAGAEAGANNPPLGGAGGAAEPGPPDLIESSGGPWPDSLSAMCSSASKLIACPQLDAAFFGQDGTYRINVPSYTTSATTVTDKVTGLMWQKQPASSGGNHAAAVSYCDNLDLAGHQDWRLPSRLEYVSVLDLGLGSGYAMPGAFPIETTGDQWTSSSSGTTPDTWFSMHDGYGMWTVAVDATVLTARCVRGTPLSPSLQVGTDTVIDAMTALEWQRTALDDSDVDWEAALAYCEALEHANHDDWRLPNIKELSTIIDEAGGEGMVIDTASFGTPVAARYWSSTPALSFGSERFALALETTIGSSPSVKMTELSAARCVRSAD